MVDSGNTIIFLVSWPLTQREVNTFGFDISEEKGINIKVFDLSPILNHKALKKHPVSTEIVDKRMTKIYSYKIFAQNLKMFSNNSIFIDYILGLSDLDIQREKVFRILKKEKVLYYVVYAGALPIPIFDTTRTSIMKKWKRKIKMASEPKLLLDYIARRTILVLREKFNLYPKPVKVFSGNSDVLERFVKHNAYSLNQVIGIHSFDYDCYLTFSRNTSKIYPENICVFLDDGLIDHPDFAILGIKSVSEEEYVKNMNNLFEKIECEKGLEVIIASHPRSRYECKPEIFGNRKIIKGKTMELVSRSQFVITHKSTAINFAILFDKPIMFVKTNEMDDLGFSSYIDAMAESLGLSVINLDDNHILNKCLFDYTKWIRDKYEHYKYKFIKTPKIEELKVWEIVLQEAKKDLEKLALKDCR